ncbi:unnamed protein product [Soboliphyme baturini]|uniref:Anaphase-promoting complex subunit 1 n=1 Tax=Soboliphyme baturini TaxID=241478 RepID=A0A183ISD7_9BILA|nr:unnamed protein product [Soboliphyme baturini]
MMINPESVEEFYTFGQQFKELIIESANISKKNLGSVGRKHKLLASYSLQNEVYKCRYILEEDAVEEFFGFGNMGVLTRNDVIIQRTFSTDFDIKDVLWCDFSPAIGSPMWNNCFVLLGSNVMDVYLNNGEMFGLTLPFNVQRCFTASFGLIFERVPMKTKSEMQTVPTIFSLSHPMNELLPVVYRTSENKSAAHYLAKYLTADFISVVFSSSDSFILTYNRKTGLHGVWYSRKASNEEASAAAQCLEESFLSMMDASSLVADVSAGLNVTISGGGNVLRETRSTNVPASSLTNLTQGAGSSQQVSTGSSSEALLKLSASIQSATGGCSHSFGKQKSDSAIMTTSSVLTPGDGSKSTLLKFLSPLTPTSEPQKRQSPAVSRLMQMRQVFYHFGKTCHRSPVLTAMSISEGYPTPASRKNQSVCSTTNRNNVTESNFYWPAEPPIPDICMVLLWQEKAIFKSDARAAKAFVSTDIVGQPFLFYLIREMQQLRCLKFYYKDDGCPAVSNDPFQVISCRDACPCLVNIGI